jgi:hypothetical protein
MEVSKTVKRATILAVLMAFNGVDVAGQESASLADQVLHDKAFTWESVASERARIYYQPGSFAERHRFMILRSLNAVVEEVLETLEESSYEGTLRAFYLESREEMERAMGRPVTGYSDWGGNAIFIVLNPDWRSFEMHEFTHVVTMGTWGPPHDSCGWMIEGIAIAIDGWCREYSVDEVTLGFLADDQLPPLGEFFKDYASLGEIRAGSYGASFIRFLNERYGVEIVRGLWSGGTEALPDLLGASLGEIEGAWKSHLRAKVPSPRDVDMEVIDELGCG